jgi:hypothetical protein
MRTAILMIALGAIALVAGIKFARAHDWYPPYCCNGEDCKPIAGKDVWFNDAFGLWEFRMGGQSWMVPADAVRDDKENPGMGAHACVLYGKVRCFWKPKSGV